MQKIEIEPGATPELHELKVAATLAQYGAVKFLAPKNQDKIKTADIVWLGERWEIKSPKGKGRWLLENTIRRATKQSPNIIIDLQRAKLTQSRCIAQITYQTRRIRGIHKLKVITKIKNRKTGNRKIIDIK